MHAANAGFLHPKKATKKLNKISALKWNVSFVLNMHHFLLIFQVITTSVK
jgi:hypothetical protein